MEIFMEIEHRYWAMHNHFECDYWIGRFKSFLLSHSVSLFYDGVAIKNQGDYYHFVLLAGSEKKESTQNWQALIIYHRFSQTYFY